MPKKGLRKKQSWPRLTFFGHKGECSAASYKKQRLRLLRLQRSLDIVPMQHDAPRARRRLAFFGRIRSSQADGQIKRRVIKHHKSLQALRLLKTKQPIPQGHARDTRAKAMKMPWYSHAWHHAAIIAFLAACAYVFLFSPFFQVKEVSIALNYASPHERQSLQNAFVDYFASRSGTAASLATVTTGTIKKILESSGEIAPFRLERKLPGKLIVNIEREIPIARWREQGSPVEFGLDRNGNVFRALHPETTGESGQPVFIGIPVIENATTSPVVTDDTATWKQIMDPETLSAIEDFYRLSEQELHEVIPSRFRFDITKPFDVEVVTNEGWKIIFDKDTGLSQGLQNLKQLLVSGPLTDRTQLKYIDIRISDKIYYR